VGFAQARSTHNEPTFPPKFPMFWTHLEMRVSVLATTAG